LQNLTLSLNEALVRVDFVYNKNVNISIYYISFYLDLINFLFLNQFNIRAL